MTVVLEVTATEGFFDIFVLSIKLVGREGDGGYK